MERPGEENGLPIKFSASEPKHITGGVTPLRVIAGGLQPHEKQSQQRAQMRRFTALSGGFLACFVPISKIQEVE